MNILAVDILSLMPGFTSGAHQLHNILVGATFVMAVVGLLLLANQAHRERAMQGILGTLVRIIVIVILVGSLSGFGDLLTGAVSDVVSQMGLDSASGGIFEAYRQAVAQKWGSNGAGQPAHQGAQGQPTGSTGPAQSASGVKFTHYGYEQPGQSGYDSNSAAGIGAFPFDSAPGSLGKISGAAALSPDIVQAYNLQPGQSFNAQGADGQSFTLVYADKTADYLTGRIDVYDQSGTFGSDGVPVTSIADGPVSGLASGDGGFLGGWISRIGDSLTVAILDPLVHLLSLIALAIMWLMQGVQQILYTIEIAVSPIFLGFLLIPRLVGTGTKFLLSLASITLWGLGWAVADLLTRALIAFAVNPTNNAAQSVFSGGAMMLGYWVLLALWVILSSFFAPLIISAMLMSGSSGIAPLFGATVGAAAATAARSTGAVSHAASAATGAAMAPISVASHSAMTAFNNFARRPSASPVSGNGNGSSA